MSGTADASNNQVGQRIGAQCESVTSRREPVAPGIGRSLGAFLIASAATALAALVYARDLWRGDPLITFGPKSHVAMGISIAMNVGALVLASRAHGVRRVARLLEGATLSLSSTLLVLSIPECALRMGGYGDHVSFFGRNLEAIHAPFEEGEVGGIPYRLNSMALRDDELPAVREPREVRVLCLGDSSTFGYGVDKDAAYPQVLERLLRERMDRPVQVINGGYVGITSFQGRQLYERLASDLAVDWVTLAFGSNDRLLRPLPDAHGGSSKLMACVLQSRTFIFLCDVLAPLRRSRQARNVPRVSADEYGENLAAIEKLARSNGARTILVSLPDNPDVLSQPERARELMAQGQMEMALLALGEITRFRFFNPYPEAFELKAEIQDRLGNTRIAEEARREAELRRRLTPRLRDERPHREAMLATCRATGARAVVFDAACAKGKLLDIVHPNSTLHVEIASALADVILGREGFHCR